MSGQGWDETKRNTSESKAKGRLSAFLENCRGMKREGQIMHKSTYKLHTQPPPPSKKNEKKKPHHLTPNRNIINKPFLCCPSCLI